MENVYIKYYWEEEDILFYFHYKDDWAVALLEITKGYRIRLTEDEPDNGNLELTDQPLSEAELKPEHYISEEEFRKAWEAS